MTTYALPITDTHEAIVYVTPSAQGYHAHAEIAATHKDGTTETYGGRDGTHYVGYCLTEAVAHEALRIVSNYPKLSDLWNVWESLPTGLPECECE